MSIRQFIDLVEAEFNVPDDVYNFIGDLSADDTGRETIRGFTIRFEAFTDVCQQDAEARTKLPATDPRHLHCYQDVYSEVMAGWEKEEGGEPLDSGMTGDDDYPVMWAVWSPKS